MFKLIEYQKRLTSSKVLKFNKTFELASKNSIESLSSLCVYAIYYMFTYLYYVLFSKIKALNMTIDIKQNSSTVLFIGGGLHKSTSIFHHKRHGMNCVVNFALISDLFLLFLYHVQIL